MVLLAVLALGLFGVGMFAFAAPSLPAPTISAHPANPTNVTTATFTYTDSSSIRVANGGTVLAGALTQLDGVGLYLDATGTLPISQWTAFTNGFANVTGGTATFTNLADIDGSGKAALISVPLLG